MGRGRRYNTGDDQDLIRWLTRLNDRVDALETAARAGYTSVDTGAFAIRDADGRIIIELGKSASGHYGFTVYDSTGTPVVRAGELASGGYGLEVNDGTGKLVKLSTLAFGIRSASVDTFQGTDSGDWVDLATVGPRIPDVEIGNTGRCLVIVSARLTALNNGAAMSFEVSGATALPPHGSRQLSLESITAEANGSVSRAFLLENLNPGLHTFTAKYASTGGGVFANFAERNLTVMPF